MVKRIHQNFHSLYYNLRRNIENIRQADDSVLIADSERKMQKNAEPSRQVLKERKNKGLTFNCKKTELIVISKRSNSPRGY